MKATMLARLRAMKCTYKQYLASDHWANVRLRYKGSNLPQECMGCANPRYQLHHRTYNRLGREELTDLVPLCAVCHQKLHDYEAANNKNVKDTHKILRFIFGWTKQETIQKFEPYRLSGRPNGFFFTPFVRKSRIKEVSSRGTRKQSDKACGEVGVHAASWTRTYRYGETAFKVDDVRGVVAIESPDCNGTIGVSALKAILQHIDSRARPSDAEPETNRLADRVRGQRVQMETSST